VRCVDKVTRSYRVVSLYKFLRADSQRPDLRATEDGRRHIERMVTVEGWDRAVVDTQLDEVACDRARIFDAVHRGDPVVIPRWRFDHDSHIWTAEIGHIDWLVDGSVDWIRVTAEDIVTPAAGPW
jgi:hypothetical protein